MVVYGKPWHRPAAWGNVPTWLLAVGAGATAWIALVQLSDLRKQITGEIRRNEKRDKLLDSQAAKLVDRVEALRPTAVAGFSFPDLAPKRDEQEDLYDEGDADEDRNPDRVLVAWFTDDAGFRWRLDEYQHLVQSRDETTYLPATAHRAVPQSTHGAIEDAAKSVSAAPSAPAPQAPEPAASPASQEPS